MICLLAFQDLIEPFACRSMYRCVTAELLPTTNRNVDVHRVDLDPVTLSPDPFHGKECGSRPQEGIENNLTPCRAVEYGIGHHTDRLDRRMKSKKVALFTLFGQGAYARVFPHIAAITAILAKLDIVAVTFSIRKHCNEFVLRSIEAAHAA